MEPVIARALDIGARLPLSDMAITNRSQSLLFFLILHVYVCVPVRRYMYTRELLTDSCRPV